MVTKKKEDLLVPLEEYLSAGVHIGTKFRTKSMASFIYKINPAGLAVLDVQKIDSRLKLAGNLLTKYAPEEIILICRRENGWKAAKRFSKLTGIKAYTGRYPAGILTNPELDTFIEPKLMIITDPWPDKNAVHDGNIMGIPVIALCDSNNTTHNADFIIPCNNKGSKSLGLVFYALAKQYIENRKISKAKIDIKEFIE